MRVCDPGLIALTWTTWLTASAVRLGSETTNCHQRYRSRHSSSADKNGCFPTAGAEQSVLLRWVVGFVGVPVLLASPPGRSKSVVMPEPARGGEVVGNRWWSAGAVEQVVPGALPGQVRR